jgi:hypothetical protein
MSTRSHTGAQAGTQTNAMAAGQDAIALLTADHREVSDMFEQFDQLGDRATTSKE